MELDNKIIQKYPQPPSQGIEMGMPCASFAQTQTLANIKKNRLNKRKPDLLIYENIIEPIKYSIRELDLINADVAAIKKNYYLKSLFAYVISLFESSITECLERFLCSCPKEIPKGKLKLDNQQNILIENEFSQNVIELLISDYVSYETYSRTESLLTKFSSILSIEDLSHLYTKDLIEKKERRNILMHNNLTIDNKYIRNTKCDQRLRGTKLSITNHYLIDTINSITIILNKIESQLSKKFGHNTKNKLIKEIWTYLFDSPLMTFEQHWILENNKIIGYNSKYLKTVVNNLSSSEKSILAYWLQNYSSSICDRFFKIKDLNMQVSNNDKMVFIVKIFNKHPLLLQD